MSYVENICYRPLLRNLPPTTVAHHKKNLIICASQNLYFADFRRHFFLTPSQMTKNELKQSKLESPRKDANEQNTVQTSEINSMCYVRQYTLIHIEMSPTRWTTGLNPNPRD